MHIVLIDDEKILSNLIREKLEAHEYTVTILENYKTFLETKHQWKVDLFLIDINLWDGSWLDIIKVLKKDPKTRDIPVIFISWHNETDLKVQGLDLWGDDYIVKPFEFDELLARIRKTLRKDNLTPLSTEIKYKNITFDLWSRRIFIKWTEIILSRKEKQIFEFFMLHPDICIKKTVLYSQFWWDKKHNLIPDNTINVTICNLRKKLWKSFYLKTVIGEWYCLIKKNKKIRD